MSVREQPRIALARANEVRVMRARLRDEMVVGGGKLLADTIEEQPDWLDRARVRHVLKWVPYMGPVAVDEALRWMDIPWNEQFDGLTDAQRSLLVRGLRK